MGIEWFLSQNHEYSNSRLQSVTALRIARNPAKAVFSIFNANKSVDRIYLNSVNLRDRQKLNDRSHASQRQRSFE